MDIIIILIKQYNIITFNDKDKPNDKRDNKLKKPFKKSSYYNYNNNNYNNTLDNKSQTKPISNMPKSKLGSIFKYPQIINEEYNKLLKIGRYLYYWQTDY